MKKKILVKIIKFHLHAVAMISILFMFSTVQAQLWRAVVYNDGIVFSSDRRAKDGYGRKQDLLFELKQLVDRWIVAVKWLKYIDLCLVECSLLFDLYGRRSTIGHA